MPTHTPRSNEHRSVLHGTRGEFLEFLADAEAKDLGGQFLVACGHSLLRIQEIRAGADPTAQEVATLYVNVYGRDAPPVVEIKPCTLEAAVA